MIKLEPNIDRLKAKCHAKKSDDRYTIDLTQCDDKWYIDLSCDLTFISPEDAIETLVRCAKDFIAESKAK